MNRMIRRYVQMIYMANVQLITKVQNTNEKGLNMCKQKLEKIEYI